MADIKTRPDWATEEEYWRQSYKQRPYVETGRSYEFYSPGYRYGYEAAERYPDRTWTDVEADLRRDWDRYEYRGQSTWDQMKNAVKDAWDRIIGNR